MMPRYRPPRWPTANFLSSRAKRQPPTTLGAAAVDALRDLQQRYNRVPAIGRQAAQEAEDWAKANAPWKDRSGAARANLSVDFIDYGRTYALRFAHGVYYGRFLEYRWGGRYAILRPAANIWVNRLRDRLRRLFRRTVGAFSLRSVIDTTSAFDPRSGKTSTRGDLW